MNVTRWIGAVAMVLGASGCSSPEDSAPTQPDAATTSATTEAAPAPEPKAVDGKVVFLQCAACHSLDAAAGAKIGPSLAGVVGRKAGAVEGFAYSDAMSGSGITWTREELDRFLEKPMQVVPGSKMAFAGIADDARRAAVIDYIAGEAGQGTN